MKKNGLILSIILAMSMLMSSVMAQAPEDEYELIIGDNNWYIVELEQPSLSAYARSSHQLSAMTVDGKLDVQTAASQAYIAQLETDQVAFTTRLIQAIPDAVVGYKYQIVLNAIAVQLPDNGLQALKKLGGLPGITKITPQHIYTIDMDYSLDLINAAAMWSKLGGQDSAGAGIKIAIIDSGIDSKHPLFNGNGWSYPTTGTWPKGYCETAPGFCNGKIIAARYYKPTMKVNENEELTPQDHHGHGTHVGGTAAGNRTTITFGTETTEISGVAPGAWLMAYKGLFLNAAGNSAAGSDIMLVAAVEDAIKDGADVINNSWGGTAWELDDALSTAYEAAVDAGIVVVFAAGNDGPKYNTIDNPYSPDFIMVGASTTKRAFYNTVRVTAPTPVSDTLKSFAGNEFRDIASSAIPTGTIGPLPYIPCNLLGNPDTTLAGVTVGITQTDPYSTTGWIALIPRGAHNFTTKLDNAIAQGARAVVMYTDSRSWKGGFTAGDRNIYSVMVDHNTGLDARSWWVTYTNAARIEIGYPVSAFTTEKPDVIADFSSRGPWLDLNFGPDVVAPGVNILSGIPNNAYAAWGGTSMAAPHVAGAAALLKSLHPGWTPAQIKSALMSTASQTVLNLDKTTVANVMTQGAGRIDLGRADDPGLTFSKPSYSFGIVTKGTTVHTVITAKDVSGAAEIYSLNIQETVTNTGHVTVTVAPATANIAAGGTAVFTITIETDASATTQDIEGNVVLSGAVHLAHVPYWARLDPNSVRKILLIDDDLHGLLGGMGEYQSAYTTTLTALGLNYDIWDTADKMGMPKRDVLDRYDVVVYFAGDGPTFFFVDARWGPFGGGTASDLRSYLAGGGKMIAFGEDAARGMKAAKVPGVIFFGNVYDKNNAFGSTAIPKPSAVGVAPFLKNVLIDFNPAAGDGAGNMSTVDSLRVPDFSDVSNIPLFTVPNTFTDTQGAGYLGSAISSDPTLERVADPIDSDWLHIGYRTTFCSFGLEAVNDNTGYYTSTALLNDLFNYVNDDLVVAFDESRYAADTAFSSIRFTATMTSSVGAKAVSYRWDLGDGSGYAGTNKNTISHQYTVPGVYTARVQVIDEYGHTMVSKPVLVYIGHQVYLPIVFK